jgi:hypothetical protein
MSLQRPSSFVELRDVDPKTYFDGNVSVVSTWLPDHLLAAVLRGKTEPDD